jgi:hypothetical protein
MMIIIIIIIWYKGDVGPNQSTGEVQQVREPIERVASSR